MSKICDCAVFWKNELSLIFKLSSYVSYLLFTDQFQSQKGIKQQYIAISDHLSVERDKEKTKYVGTMEFSL